MFRAKDIKKSLPTTYARTHYSSVDVQPVVIKTCCVLGNFAIQPLPAQLINTISK